MATLVGELDARPISRTGRGLVPIGRPGCVIFRCHAHSERSVVCARMEIMVTGFWQQVLDSDMAVPNERPLNELTAELVGMLGSTNPVERDEIAFPVLASWVTDGVYDDLLVTFGDALANGLRQGLGNHDDDTVFRRSACARVLTECVRRDNVAHVLPGDAVVTWADRALGWYVREADLRGWVDGKGWAMSVAYGADLIGALGQSRHLGRVHLGILLDVLAERVLASSGRSLTDGEDDRCAAAALMILQRNLLDSDELDLWVDRLGRGMVRPRAYNPEAWPSPSARNTSAFVRALYLHLAIGIHPSDSTLSFDEPPECRADLLLSLLAVVPRLTPWLHAPQQR